MCVCLSVCNGSGKFRTRLVTHDLHTYTLYYVCVITSGRTRGAEGWSTEAPKQTLSGTTAKAYAFGEQQLKQMQPGCSSVWPCETSAHQRHYRTIYLVMVKDWVKKWCESHFVKGQSHTLSLSYWSRPHSKWRCHRLLSLAIYLRSTNMCWQQKIARIIKLLVERSALVIWSLDG